MKTKGLFMLAVLAILATVGFTSCDELSMEDNPMQAYMTMRTSDVTLKHGETYLRKAVAAGTAEIKYSSSDEAVATVDQQGKVTANAVGTTVITARTTGYNAEGKQIYIPEEKSYKVTVALSLSSPLTLEVLSEGDKTIVIANPQPNMKYQKNGESIVKITSTDDVTIDVVKGDKVAFYGDGKNITSYYDGTTSTKITGGTADVKVYGNIMSLVDETDFATADALTAAYTFQQLFEGNTHLTDASDLMLPATTLTASCYTSMFIDCTNLAKAPKELPAPTLSSLCYFFMFNGCTNLTTAPELKATAIDFLSCGSMFRNCHKLSSVVCLATSFTGFSPNSNTQNWLDGAGTDASVTSRTLHIKTGQDVTDNNKWHFVSSGDGATKKWTVVADQ
jgi:hypothetical protein